jgi:hypothetical protein
VRIIWSEIAQATFVRFMADQAGMMAVNRAVEALADDPAPLGAFVRDRLRSCPDLSEGRVTVILCARPRGGM